MFYEEKIIDGVLSFRNSPDGDWIPFTPEKLTAKFSEIKARYCLARGIVQALVDLKNPEEPSEAWDRALKFLES